MVGWTGIGEEGGTDGADEEKGVRGVEGGEGGVERERVGYNNVWTMGGRGSARICERSSESSSSLSTNPTIALQEGGG